MKPQVHYAYLEDMKKYIEGLDPEDYTRTCSETDQEVIDFARDYYASHLPVDALAWLRVNEPRKELIYKQGFYDQIHFVREKINGMLRSTYEEWSENPPMVISTHVSKSITLPVLRIYLEKYDIEIILRDNFYDWKVSISSKEPLEFDFMGLFETDEDVPCVYCEGFPSDKVYGCYDDNHSQFTFEIANDYDLYMFFYLLKRYLGIKRED